MKKWLLGLVMVVSATIVNSPTAKANPHVEFHNGTSKIAKQNPCIESVIQQLISNLTDSTAPNSISADSLDVLHVYKISISDDGLQYTVTASVNGKGNESGNTYPPILPVCPHIDYD